MGYLSWGEIEKRRKSYMKKTEKKKKEGKREKESASRINRERLVEQIKRESWHEKPKLFPWDCGGSCGKANKKDCQFCERKIKKNRRSES